MIIHENPVREIESYFMRLCDRPLELAIKRTAKKFGSHFTTTMFPILAAQHQKIRNLRNGDRKHGGK